MKNSYGDIIKLRRQVFTTVAKLAYEDLPLTELHKYPFDLLPGEVASYRESIFRERAVLGQRLRMALGLEPQTAATSRPISEGIENIDVDHRVYREPLVQVISIACEACPERFIHISDNCRKCLAHPCMNVCPKNAISPGKDRMIIDHEKCIKCGRCIQECPYNAILETGRPCSEACGVDAIGSDYLGRAEIDWSRCVACGNCIQTCPFGAISDKSQIYQLIKKIKSGVDVYAIVAPSFAGQFGFVTSPEQVFEAIKKLGIKDVYEVGLGADLTTMNEAKEFVDEVPEKRPYMGTSCCYSWKSMVNKLFPDQSHLISESSTPMIYTALQIKKRHPDGQVVFIGPCISKKLEALQDRVKDYINFVITYEELMGMFIAREIEPSQIEVSEDSKDASETGRNYGFAGGVSTAVASRIHELDPDLKVKAEKADGLAECVKMIRLAKAGQKDGMLLEGMACKQGCVGGPGTIVPFNRARQAEKKFAAKSPYKSPADNAMIPEEDRP